MERKNEMIKRQELIELLTDLVAIDSSNAWLLPGSPGEKDVHLFMADYLKKWGVEAKPEKASPENNNLVAEIKGTGGGRNLTLYAHADTVGYSLWQGRALQAAVAGNRMTGLGAADDKGHCAAILLAVKALSENGIRLKGDLHLCLAADEEGASCGSFAYTEKHAPEAALVMEPSPLGEICITHQGFGWLLVRVKGKAAHGSATDIGVDAITRMAEVVVRMEKNRRENFAKNPHPLNGETVYHTGTIKGGTDYATFPDCCELGIEIGTQPGETMDDRIREIEDIFREVREIYPDFEGSVEALIARSPFEAKGHEDLLAVVSEVLMREAGVEVQQVGANSWGDAQIFQDAGFPTMEIGARGENYHAPEEWVDLDELLSLTNMLVSIIREYCGEER